MYASEHYMFSWDWCYAASPDDRSDADVESFYSDHCDGGFTFDGHQYRAWGYDPTIPEDIGEFDEPVPCPGPYLPPLQGPATGRDAQECGDLQYWATSHARFVYDEAAELARRAESPSRYTLPVSAPGLSWCEFA